MEQLLPLLTNLATGAVGGNVAGAALKEKSLGFIGNTVAGLVGGGLGGTLLTSVLGNMGLAGMTGDVASSGIGGMVMMSLLSYAKPYLAQYGINLDQLLKIGGGMNGPKQG